MRRKSPIETSVTSVEKAVELLRMAHQRQSRSSTLVITFSVRSTNRITDHATTTCLQLVEVAGLTNKASTRAQLAHGRDLAVLGDAIASRISPFEDDEEGSEAESSEGLVESEGGIAQLCRKSLVATSPASSVVVLLCVSPVAACVQQTTSTCAFGERLRKDVQQGD